MNLFREGGLAKTVNYGSENFLMFFLLNNFSFFNSVDRERKTEGR